MSNPINTIPGEMIEQCSKCEGARILYVPKLERYLACPHCRGLGYFTRRVFLRRPA